MYIRDNGKPYLYGILGTTAATVASAKAVGVFKLDKNKVSDVNNAINTVVSESTNLEKNGLKIKNMTSFSDSDFAKLPKFLNPDKNIIRGKNASFSQFDNVIAINREKIPLAAFHEIGHAYNKQSSNILRKIQYASPVLGALGILAAFLPIIITPAPERDNVPMTFGEKLKNKIRSSSPFLAAACYIPIVAEEGIASLRASQLAKPLLQPEIYKKMVRGNICGFLTYFGSMVACAMLAKYFLSQDDCNNREKFA